MKNKLIFILWLLMFSFFSCDFGIKENEETNSKEYFTVKGSCSIQGAIPSDLFPEKSIKQNAQRTVVPKIEIGEITVSFESETGDTKSAEVVNKDFEIELPPGKWTVKAQGKKSDDVIIESESCQIELPAENTNVKLVLKPTQSDTGKGFFKFSFGMEPTKVSRMEYTYEKHGATESEPTYTINDFSAPINKELSSGVYTFRFDFYSSTNELLYSFKEVVNIFDGLTTDTWIGAGEYIDGGKICITDNMISQFISTTVYVSNDGNDSNLGTFFEPVKTIQQAVDNVIAMNEVTTSSEGNPYKILLLSDIYTPSDDSFRSNNALVNIDPSSASGNPLYLTISKYGDENATINANRTDSNTGRVMYIGKNANVTLQKLILTGGHLIKDNGAGLYILNNDANVKIVNSEISKNEIDNGVGAGLHVGNKSLDGNLNLTIENSKISSNTINHNDTIGGYSGAGIAIENVAVTLTITNSEISENVIDQKYVGASTPKDKGVGLWLGNYATTIISGTEISGTDIKNNKIIEAKTTNGNAGGGICIDGGTLTINGTTKISDNLSGYGGGVCIFGGNFTMSNGAEISNCTGDYAGGIIIDTGGTFTMNDGATISTCTSLQYGGGVVVYDSDDGIPGTGGTFTMNGGAISGCTAKNGLGGGVYVEKGTFNMNDGAVISSDNDVYLADGTTITVTEKLTSTDTVATITPENYELGIQVLKAESGVTLNKYPGNFAVTLSDGHENWFVDSAGYLVGGSVTEPNKSENEEYEVSSLENLLWIALELKKESFKSFKMKLTDDIVIPSGKWQFYQLDVDNASIDGQGHSIKIIEDVSKFGNSAGGLFYKCNYSTVKNLVLNGSITADTSKTVNQEEGRYIGALCRSAYGSIFENIMSEVTITDTGYGFAGGLIGRLGTSESYDPTKAMVKNCAVYADVSSTNGIAGGILGAIWDVTRCCTIQNSIYMGEIKGTTVGAIAGRNGNNNLARSELKNIWYCVTNKSSIPLIGTKADTTIENITDVESKSDDDIASDGAEDLLNTDSDETDNYVWEYDSSLGYPTLKTLSSE